MHLSAAINCSPSLSLSLSSLLSFFAVSLGPFVAPFAAGLFQPRPRCTTLCRAAAVFSSFPGELVAHVALSLSLSLGILRSKHALLPNRQWREPNFLSNFWERERERSLLLHRRIQTAMRDSFKFLRERERGLLLHRRIQTAMRSRFYYYCDTTNVTNLTKRKICFLPTSPSIINPLTYSNI